MNEKKKCKCLSNFNFTTIGYFFLGALVIVVGFAYTIDTGDSGVIISTYAIIKELFYNCAEIFISFLLSAFFYWIFFSVRKGIMNIQQTYDDKNWTNLLGLRKRYLSIRKKRNHKGSINTDDINTHIKSKKNKKALTVWLSVKKKIIKIMYTYFAFAIVITVFFTVMNYGKLPWFFITYTFLFLFSTMFYVYLFSALHFKSFMRLSYTVLFPTILSIAINFYFGLSAKAILSNSLLSLVFLPILIFVLFLVLTAFFEVLSYSRPPKCRNRFSTNGFVYTSIVLLSLSIIIFVILVKNQRTNMRNPFSDLMFSIALSLFLGIFEGWDALKQMNIPQNSKIFARHYRWWNFLQICYPIAFFFLMGTVNSQIFTFGLMLVFTGVSVASTIVWKKGGEKKKYISIKWERRKLFFGILTIAMVFVNKVYFMKDIRLKEPGNLSTEVLSAEFIVFLLGMISSIFVFWGVALNKQKKIMLMALPFRRASKYIEFSEFCKYGYIYDFSSYIYLLYILIVHILLFGTNLLPGKNVKAADASMILMTFIVVIYMILSFLSKILNYERKGPD